MKNILVTAYGNKNLYILRKENNTWKITTHIRYNPEQSQDPYIAHNQ